jgi:phosphoribosylglycinamide formyltransferase 1
LAERAKVGVLFSGRGSNLAALIYAAKHADCPFEIVLAASNDPAAEGLALAAAEGVPTFALSHKGLDRAAFDARIDAELRDADVEVVALAGYLRLLSPAFVGGWRGRIVNIHPSLLPAHKGLGTHAAVLAAGETVSGCTVHEVTEALDDGPLLGQTRVAVLPGDTADSLAARVLIAEHQLYPRCLADFVTRERGADYLIARVRDLALALPEADEVTSHGMPCFGIVKGKKFAYVSVDHHGDGRTALLVKISGPEEQATLIEADPDRYYRPPYFGDGWIGIRLDLGDTDWPHIDDWLTRSWRSIAPKRLAMLPF